MPSPEAFVADFIAANKKATRADVIAAWHELKQLDAPKNYRSWIGARASRKGKKPAARRL